MSDDPIEAAQLGLIRELADHGLQRSGAHGPIASLGVPLSRLPRWDDIQLLTAQLARLPLLEDAAVGTDVVLGPRAQKPLKLEIPLLVADMAFGSMSLESKIALAKGAEGAGTAIGSGESGVLLEEQQACSRYLLQIGSARWGWNPERMKSARAVHLKLGQASKTGTGGHLVGSKNVGRIAEVHCTPEGTTLVAPSRFPDLHTPEDYKAFVAQLRELTGGVPVGAKLSAQHIEDDLDAALAIGFDYVILDGRGAGTAAAPTFFRDNISVPTIPALARARRHLDGRNAGITLIASGGMRVPADFVKALALGADAIALGTAAIEAIGCLGIRQCHTNTCPVGIATQDPVLRAGLEVDMAAAKLTRFLLSSVQLMKLMARACGHAHLNGFEARDLTTWNREMAQLAGIAYAGVA